MLLKFALLSSFLLASAALVLAVPSSRYDARAARRREGRQSQFNNRFEKLASAASVSNSVYSNNWAGAFLNQPQGTFTSVTATFTVPTPLSEDNTAASAWVGIDGDTCQEAILQTGVDFTLSGGQVFYDAWYEWYPHPAYDFSGIDVSAGDVITLTVVASSNTYGTATVENLTNGQTVSQDLSSTTYPLCGQDAEWIVEDFMLDGNLVPFANFGTVTFTNAEATGNGDYTPSDATTIDIEQNNQALTSSSIDGSSVTITYV